MINLKGSLTSHTFKCNGRKLIVNCFDEDSEMSIVISDSGRKSKSVFSLTIDEAEDLARFINHHVKIEKEANPS